jgi:pimeloyl-ACP methyl ester carboxylesterase
MAYASVNGLQLYYGTRGSGRPLVLLHGGLMTIGLNFGPLLESLAASRQVIAVELQGQWKCSNSCRTRNSQYSPRDHARRRDTAAPRSVRVDHTVPRRALSGGHARIASSRPPHT